MMINYNSVKKGLAFPVILIIVAIVVATGATATGVYVYTQNQARQEENKEKTQENNNANNATPTPELQEANKQNEEASVTPTSTPDVTPIQENTPTPTPTQAPQTPTATPTRVQTPTVSPTPTKQATRYSDAPRPGGFNYIDNEVQVTATRASNGIRLSWSRCNSNTFVAYKVARSETASDVYFPRDGAVASIANQNTLSYTDTNVNPGTTYYYRICSLESDGSSWCGNVVKISY